MTGQWIFAVVMALLGVLVIRAGLRIFRERSTRTVRFVGDQIKVDIIGGFPALLIGLAYVGFGAACLFPVVQLAMASLANTSLRGWDRLIVPPVAGFFGLFVFAVLVGLVSSLFRRKD